MQERALRVMGEARKDLDFVIVQDPWFSQLDWSPKKKSKAEKGGEAGSARHSLAKLPKLEEIANSEKPRTPALGRDVTYALSKEYLPNEFGSDYMPLRINWLRVWITFTC